ncbi:uncharacterized protein LOC109855503 [Pseudomyrmex gracilis]|uniref:uncharacterized protein LOC109855503 n=1 Tax=Pseudomyrmex gracilis TaxID=219809 RepID=UPI0009956C2D|nr:uncharacterized protein LOC109855503 [Pseudomyrmex gracilis]
MSTHYAVGENVTANCTAWPSVPKANLRWTINDEPVRREDTVQNPPLLPIVNGGGFPNSLGLWLEAEQRHFINDAGEINVKCIAEVGSKVYLAEKKITTGHVNRQRLSAGDHLRSTARIVRANFLVPLLATIFTLVRLTT